MGMSQLSKEMIINFKLQHPERYNKYEKFFEKDICFKSQRAIQEGILTYCDMLEDMQFLVDLIKLNETSEESKK